MVAVLEGQGLTYDWPSCKGAIYEVDVAVRPGEVLVIAGPNGAGKSTLLRMLAGLLAPVAGEVRLRGLELGSLKARERAREVALVPQAIDPFVPTTVAAFVDTGRYAHRSRLGPVSASERSLVCALLREYGLWDLVARPMDALSGGQRQQALLCRGEVQAGSVLLVDEPTNALDLGRQLEAFTRLRAIASRGLAVAVVTHELNLASQFADRILLLADGRAVAEGPPREVITPEHLHPIYGPHLEFGSLLSEAVGEERPTLLGWRRPPAGAPEDER